MFLVNVIKICKSEGRVIALLARKAHVAVEVQIHAFLAVCTYITFEFLQKLRIFQELFNLSTPVN
jgi:hypothetical protein